MRDFWAHVYVSSDGKLGKSTILYYYNKISRTKIKKLNKKNTRVRKKNKKYELLILARNPFSI